MVSALGILSSFSHRLTDALWQGTKSAKICCVMPFLLRRYLIRCPMVLGISLLFSFFMLVTIVTGPGLSFLFVSVDIISIANRFFDHVYAICHPRLWPKRGQYIAFFDTSMQQFKSISEKYTKKRLLIPVKGQGALKSVFNFCYG